MAYGRRDPNREAFWRLALARQRQSGLGVGQWCSAHGVTDSAFYYWRTTLARRDRNRGATGAPAFLPIVLSPPKRNEGSGRITVRLRGGRVMRLPTGMDAAGVAALVHAIEGPSSTGEDAA
jgi:transposase-like protein